MIITSGLAISVNFVAYIDDEKLLFTEDKLITIFFIVLSAIIGSDILSEWSDIGVGGISVCTGS